jgi:alkanesulfonate monooxygenase SsuD/methylene tetrahydromethanopterin reductase-like flavin-dependent oxidoreductase (luciferase family)
VGRFLIADVADAAGNGQRLVVPVGQRGILAPRRPGFAVEPHPPILIGGGSAAAFRRGARFSDGWHALSQSPEMMRASSMRLADACAEAGCNVEDLQISVRAMIEIVLDANSPELEVPRRVMQHAIRLRR